MIRHALASICVAASLAACSTPRAGEALAAGAATPVVSGLSAALEPGRYAVGLRVLRAIDAGRPFGDDGRARSLQVLLWYPAAVPGTPVTYEDYFRLGDTEVEPSETGSREWTGRLSELREMAIEAGAEPKRLDALLAAPARAVAGAEPAAGRFPIVVFSPGMGAPAFQSTVLCEYLASHGFLVAASPSIGPRAREMPESVAGLEAQVEDVRRVVETVGRQAAADAGRVGLIGYSWGGLAVLLEAMDDPRISAVAALDPTVMVTSGHELARRVPGYRPERLRVPILLMIAAAKEWPARDLGFFDEVPHADASLIRFLTFTHGDFASTIVDLLVATRPGHGGRDLGAITAGHTAMCRYLRAFFEAHLVGDPAARRFLASEPSQVGVPEGVVTIERRPPDSAARAVRRQPRR